MPGRLVALLVVAVMLVLSMPAMPVVAQTPAASRALIGQSDLPPGWTLESTGPDSTDPSVGDECGDGPPIPALSSATISYKRDGDVAFLMQNVMLFAPGDAAAAMAYHRADYSNCNGTREGIAGFALLPLPTFGDETIAIHGEIPGADRPTGIDIALVHAGDAIIMVTHVSELRAGAPDTALLEHVVRLTLERLRAK